MFLTIKHKKAIFPIVISKTLLMFYHYNILIYIEKILHYYYENNSLPAYLGGL